MGMGGIWELLDGKSFSFSLSFRWEWEWDRNGDEVIEMGGICYEKSIPAHLYYEIWRDDDSDNQYVRHIFVNTSSLPSKLRN